MTRGCTEIDNTPQWAFRALTRVYSIGPMFDSSKEAPMGHCFGDRRFPATREFSSNAFIKSGF